jgi:hypothetical protein
LTSYTHHSELQAITALLLISTNHKSLQAKTSPSSCVFISRFLVTALTVDVPLLWVPELPRCLNYQLLAKNELFTNQLILLHCNQLNSLIVLLIISKHRRHKSTASLVLYPLLRAQPSARTTHKLTLSNHSIGSLAAA